MKATLAAVLFAVGLAGGMATEDSSDSSITPDTDQQFVDSSCPPTLCPDEDILCKYFGLCD